MAKRTRINLECERGNELLAFKAAEAGGKALYMEDSREEGMVVGVHGVKFKVHYTRGGIIVAKEKWRNVHE